MEILQSIKATKLRQFVTPLSHHLELPYLQQPTTTGFHIIDHNRARHKVIEEIIQKHFQTSTSQIIVLDLDYFWNVNNESYQNLQSNLTPDKFNKIVFKSGFSNINALIKFVKNLKKIQFYRDAIGSVNSILGMIIVDNISVFHWPTKLQDHHPMECKSLFAVLNTIQAHFNCVMITTSLCKFFETGLSVPPTNTLKDLTMIPPELIQNIIVYELSYRNKSINGKLFHKDRNVSVIKNSEISHTVHLLQR